MKGKMAGKFLTAVLCGILLVSAIPVHAEEKITPSKKDYNVVIGNSSCIFIGNNKPIDYEVGRKYFLTYTVDQVDENKTTQSGLVITTEKKEQYPHTKGGMYFTQQSIFLEEGYTYFFRFEVTEEGLRYVASKAKGSESEYLFVKQVAGDINTKGQYFGVWMAESGTASASLSHVRCYDEYGNDLGVYGNEAMGVAVMQPGEMEPNTDIGHSYAFSLKDAGEIAVSNGRYTQSDVVYMEYTINNIKQSKVTQSGVLLSCAPMNTYPHEGANGAIRFEYNNDETFPCKWLVEGARYLMRFTRTEEDFSVWVKRTVNGKTDYFSFPSPAGVFNPKNGYFSLWIGESCVVSADFTDVKCYDSTGKNLGIQTNKGVQIEHFGGIEDYTKCDAVYYCKENDTFITLDDERNASIQVDGAEDYVAGTYLVEESTLTFDADGTKQEYEYVYTALTDADGNVYKRLRDVDVTYVSKTIFGEKLETVTVTADSRYKLAKPADPTRDGRKFQHWATGDGKEYDFEEVVTEAMTLYATWDGDEEYVPTSINVGGVYVPIVVVAASSLALVGGTVVGIIITVRRKKRG